MYHNKISFILCNSYSALANLIYSSYQNDKQPNNPIKLVLCCNLFK